METVKVAEIQFYPWDRSYFFSPAGFNLKLGDRVVVETTVGQEIGKVIGFGEVAQHELESPLQPILRIPTDADLSKMNQHSDIKDEAIDFARDCAREYNLAMKFIDVVFSFDDKRMTFAFTANSRVDFRELVKKLATKYHKQIRLQQIGSRDVVAEMGGIGPCGRETCCSTWLNDLGNVNAELVPIQQLEHRGSDRLSGLCGRLKCCLAYESEGYRMCSSRMPEVGTFMNTKTMGPAEVISRNVLTHEVTVKTRDGKRETVALGCNKAGCNGCSANKKCGTGKGQC